MKKTNVIFEFLFLENITINFCQKFRLNVLGGQNFHFQRNSKSEKCWGPGKRLSNFAIKWIFLTPWNKGNEKESDCALWNEIGWLSQLASNNNITEQLQGSYWILWANKESTHLSVACVWLKAFLSKLAGESWKVPFPISINI